MSKSTAVEAVKNAAGDLVSVVIADETGLPLLPEGLYWEVEREQVKIMRPLTDADWTPWYHDRTVKIPAAGASTDELDSVRRNAVYERTHYGQETAKEDVETRVIYSEALAPKHRLFRKPVMEYFAKVESRERASGEVFSSKHAIYDADGEWNYFWEGSVTPDNLVAVASQTFLAYTTIQESEKIYGKYPPMKFGA